MHRDTNSYTHVAEYGVSYLVMVQSEGIEDEGAMQEQVPPESKRHEVK